MSYWYLKLINSEFVLHSFLIVLHISLSRVQYGRKWLLSRAVNFNYFSKKISMQYMPLPPSGLNSYGHSPINLMLYFLQLHFSLCHCSVLICHHGLRCVIAMTRYNILCFKLGGHYLTDPLFDRSQIKEVTLFFLHFLCHYLNFPFWRCAVGVNAIAYQKIYCKMCTLRYCWLELEVEVSLNRLQHTFKESWHQVIPCLVINPGFIINEFHNKSCLVSFSLTSAMFLHALVNLDLPSAYSLETNPLWTIIFSAIVVLMIYCERLIGNQFVHE